MSQAQTLSRYCKCHLICCVFFISALLALLVFVPFLLVEYTCYCVELDFPFVCGVALIEFSDLELDLGSVGRLK